MTPDDRDLLRRLAEPSEPVVEPPRPLPTTLAGTPATSFDEAWDDNLPPKREAPTTPRATILRARLRHAARLGIFALAVIGGLLGAAVLWIHLNSDPLADARAYFDAASRLNAGKPLYPAGADPNAAEFYRYPPLLAVALRPLALLGYPAFALVWEGVVLASFGLLIRRLGVRSERTWLAIGLLGIPIGWALSIAQAQVPMTLLLAIGQPWSIAFAANLKLFPALIALWWIGRRDWQATFAFAAWTVLLALAQAVLEFKGSVAFVRSVGLAEVGHVVNFSPYAISPAAWAILVGAGIFAVLVLARTRWGWPAAVALATLSPPRLIHYLLISLIAALREPEVASLPAPEPRPSPWRSG